jgi:hypothetical protein
MHLRICLYLMSNMCVRQYIVFYIKHYMCFYIFMVSLFFSIACCYPMREQKEMSYLKDTMIQPIRTQYEMCYQYYL